MSCLKQLSPLLRQREDLYLNVVNVKGNTLLSFLTISTIVILSQLRYMKYISLKPNRLHCATCDETYSLPLNGHIKLYKELRCVSNMF
jgi:hypothetical protein